MTKQTQFQKEINQLVKRNTLEDEEEVNEKIEVTNLSDIEEVAQLTRQNYDALSKKLIYLVGLLNEQAEKYLVNLSEEQHEHYAKAFLEQKSQK